MARQQGAAAIHFEVRVEHLALLDRWRRGTLAFVDEPLPFGGAKRPRALHGGVSGRGRRHTFRVAFLPKKRPTGVARHQACGRGAIGHIAP